MNCYLVVEARWFGGDPEVDPVCRLHKESFESLCLIFVNLRESHRINRLIRVHYMDIQLRSTSNVALVH